MNNVEKLRKKMNEESVNIVIIPSGDFHQSEYSCEYFKLVKFFSGFTGSAGTLVVTENEAALFTDGRYYIQAEKEIDNSVIKLMRSGMEGVPTVMEYVKEKCRRGDTIAFDGRIVSAGFGMELEEELENVADIMYDFEPAQGIYSDRPSLPKEKVFVLEEQMAGESTESKLIRVRNAIKQENAEVHILSSLEDICWCLNIRGNDISYTPVVMSYLIITESETVLFSDRDKYDDKIIEYLMRNGIRLAGYEEFYNELKLIKGKVLIDKKKVNYYIYKTLSQSNECIYKENPSTYMKAVKNKTEIRNLKCVHLKDGVAVTKFILWLKENVGKMRITEYTAAMKLYEFRQEQEGFIEESFETICAYMENAAMMHYSCDKQSAKVLEPKGMLLVDSGGQYFEGTTDVTRTFSLGEVSEEEKKSYTLVLKGMMNLAHAKFLYGCTGYNLDILARGPLWESGIDYRCGTGHGVSYLLGVHEGPNSIRWKQAKDKNDACVFEAGMVTSNEPGVYVEGKYGIRIENEILCINMEKNEYGQFMGFETLTMVPIDTDLVDVKYLEKRDIDRINTYNKMVISSLLPYFDEKEADLLKKNVKIIY